MPRTPASTSSCPMEKRFAVGDAEHVPRHAVLAGSVDQMTRYVMKGAGELAAREPEKDRPVHGVIGLARVDGPQLAADDRLEVGRTC